jgi:hypothetical protein
VFEDQVVLYDESCKLLNMFELLSQQIGLGAVGSKAVRNLEAMAQQHSTVDVAAYNTLETSYM